MKSFLIVFSIFFAIVFTANAQAPPEPAGVIRFIDSIPCTPVKDQGQSPTCWVFGTNSLFESDLLKTQGLSFNLSEMFIARHAYIDKARQYVATGGKTYFAGGGQFHDVLRIINKYGIVPEEAYSGKKASAYLHDHSKLDTSMKTMLTGFVRRKMKNLTSAAAKQLNDTLDKYLGKIPTHFLYKNKQYTPLSFAKELVRFSNDYIELVSFSDKPLYKKFMLQDKFNWANDSFYNVTLDDLKMITDTALHKGWSVGWEGDVTEPEFRYIGGFASIADSARDYDRQRLDNYKTEATERDHMLHITGVTTDEDNKRWYYMKNSWGTYFSKYKGYMLMEENYFRLKTVILMVNKQALPGELLKKLRIPL